jgi:hypothetical protein
VKTTNPTTTVKAQPENVPTKRERRAAQLLAHYEKCEALARFLGKPNPNGKRISNALRVLEYEANNAATAQCNGTSYNGQPFRSLEAPSAQAPALSEWEYYVDSVRGRVSRILGDVPPGFKVNADARGYALKIDNDNANGQNLIKALRLHTDWGGYGILSPEIDGH